MERVAVKGASGSQHSAVSVGSNSKGACKTMPEPDICSRVRMQGCCVDRAGGGDGLLAGVVVWPGSQLDARHTRMHSTKGSALLIWDGARAELNSCSADGNGDTGWDVGGELSAVSCSASRNNISNAESWRKAYMHSCTLDGPSTAGVCVIGPDASAQIHSSSMSHNRTNVHATREAVIEMFGCSCRGCLGFGSQTARGLTAEKSSTIAADASCRIMSGRRDTPSHIFIGGKPAARR